MNQQATPIALLRTVITISLKLKPKVRHMLKVKQYFQQTFTEHGHNKFWFFDRMILVIIR